MKVDRKTKLASDSKEVKTTKQKSRRANSKSVAKTNGRHPLAAYEPLPIGIVEAAPDGRYMDVNEEFCRILGYARQELLRLGIKDCTHEDDYAIDTKLYEQLIEGKIPFYRLEKRYLRKDGEDIWVELTRTLVCDEKGKPLYTIGVVLDISDRKDVERVLRESAERLRLATSAAQMFMWEWDFRNQSYVLADNFEQVLGFSAGLLPRNQFETLWALSPKEDVQRVSEAFEKAVEQQGDFHALPYRVIHPENEQVVWLEISAKIVYDHQGNPERMFGVAQNITESKKIQDEIAVISRMPAENPNPVMRLTPDGKILYANPASATWLEDWMQGTKPTIPAELRKTVTQVLLSGGKQEVEIEHRGKCFSFTLAPIIEAGYVNLYGRDITEQKQAEEWERLSAANLLAAAEANAKFRAFFDQGSYFAGVMTLDGTVVEANRLSLDFCGFRREDVIGKKFWDCGWWNPSPTLMEMVRNGTRQAAEGKIFRTESNYFVGDGSERYVDLIITPVWDENGRLLFLAPTGTDITERKQMENTIRESEERFRAIVSQATAGIAESDMDSRFVFVNPRFCEMLGYAEEELLGKTIWELTYAEDLEENKRLFQGMLTQENPYQFEKRFIRKDGSKLWTSVSVTTIHDSTGKPKGGVGVVLDINSRKQAEEALSEFARQQEALYKLSDQLHRADSLRGVFDAALDAILSALQCHRASILLYDNTDVMRFAAWRGLSDGYRTATNGHSPWRPDAKNPKPIRMDDVRTAELEESLRTVIQEEGIGALAFIPLVVNEKLIGKFMIYYDVPHAFDEAELDLSLTIAHQLAFGIDRKHTEQALKQERELLERLFETMPVMVSMIDPESNSMRLNAEFERRIGWKSDEVTVLSLLEALYPDPEYRQHVLQRMAAAAGTNEWVEVQVRTREGRSMDSMWSNISVMEDQKLVMGIALGIDITERKQAEKRFALLAEISEMLRNVEDQYELMYTISKAVGEHLHVKRALFNEIDLEHDREIVHRDYRNGVESVAGVHRVSNYSSITSAEVASGKTVINMDSKNDPRTAQDYEKTYALSGERSYVVVPMMRENRWVASLWVSDDAPRNWSRDEVSLLETVAERTWTVIEKLRINAALRESEERYRFIVENTSDGIWWIELTEPMSISLPEDEQIEWYYNHAVIRQCNLGLARMYGYDSVEEVTGLPLRMVMPRENPLNLELSREFIRAGYRLVDSESHEIASDGRELVFLNNRIGIVEDGKLKGEWGTNRDITERKRAEEALRGSEERYRGIVNQTIGGIAETDLTGRFTMVNNRYCEITGYTREKLLNEMRMQDLTHPDDVLKNLELFGRLTADGASFEMEKRYVRPDGSIVWVHNSVSAITSADGKPQSAVAAVIDVTERKRAEEALRASESLYRTIARSIPGGGVYVIDKDFRYLVAEGPVTEAFGLSREMLEGHKILEVFPAETGQRMIDRLQQNFAGETVSFETTRNGRFYWTQQAPLLDSIGHAIIVTLDITERKRAEESLRASELRYRNLFDLVPVAVYSCDADGLIQEYNHRAVELWGREPLQNDPKAKYCGSYKIFYPDGRFMPHAECPMARVLRGETLQPHEFEILVEREDGRRRSVIAHPLLLRNEQREIIGAINCLYDITERKQAEEALRQSEERFALFMQRLPGLAWIKDIQGRYVYANDAAEKAFNTPRENLYGKTDEEIFPPEIAAQFKQNDQRALTGGEGVQVVETLKHRDGILHHSLVTKFPILGPDGTTALIGGTAFDITERLQAEEALRESEERFRALLRQATAGIVRKDAEGRLVFVNQAFCNMLGYTELDLMGKTVWEFMHPDDVAENKQSYDRLMLEGIPFKLERRFMRWDGSVIWVDASVSPIMDAEGKPQSAVAVEVDITGRKHAEEALQQLNLQLEDRVLSRTAKLRAVNQTLRDEIVERQKVEEALRKSEATARENEEKLRTLFELLPVGISFLDPEGQIIQMNPALANILKMSKEQISDQVYRSRKYIRANGTLMAPQEFASRRALTEGRTIYNVETGVILENSEVVWTSVSAAPVDVADVGAVVVTADITESKRAERALRESRERLQFLSQRLVEVQEEERRAIARELHDRVGQTLAALNINLIIISGQLEGKVDELIGTRLNDSMKLVAETIALVRDVMSNLRPSVLDDYGLEAAIESHLSQYVSRYEIDAKFEKPDQPIPRMVPSIEMTFLRIAQEALMNIARHAHASQVHLALWQEENTVCMSVQDNGLGIASWPEANRPGSHGLTIMRERAEAFGGSLEVSSLPGKGTKVEVRIPVETNNPAQSQKEMIQ